MTDTIYNEQSVIGSILIDADCLPAVTGLLTADDFIIEADKAIYGAALELSRRGDPVDPVTIVDWCKGNVSREYVAQLMETTPTAANVEAYAKLVRKESMRRSLRALSACIDGRASDMDEPGELIADAMRELERIEAQDTAKELATSSEAVLVFYDHLAKLKEGGGGFVKTGYRQLDALLGGGLFNSGLYVMAARPGMGKTTVALNILDNIDGPSLFVSLEMDMEQITAKRLSRLSGLPSDRIMTNQLTDEEYGMISEASERLSTSPAYINRKPFATVSDIGTMARKVKGLRCIIVDYFGFILPSRRRQKRNEEMTEVSVELKSLARALKVPVLCLAQLNRENMGRGNKRPQLSDLRETGALEQDADGVMFLHREDYYEPKREDEDPDHPSMMEIILEKNRHGRTGVCGAAFYLTTSKILSASLPAKGSKSTNIAAELSSAGRGQKRMNSVKRQAEQAESAEEEQMRILEQEGKKDEDLPF